MEKKNTQNKRTITYVDEVFRQIESKPDVKDIVILSQYGDSIRTTMDSNDCVQFSGLFLNLLEKVQAALLKFDASDELMMLRVRSKDNETLITPDGKITIMVVQKAQDKIQT